MTDKDKSNMDHDSRVIDRNDPLCEIKIHEQLNRSPRDAMHKYITIQVGAFNVMNRTGHNYQISEKDLVDKVQAMHGQMVGEISQADVRAETHRAETLARFEQIRPDKCIGVLINSVIVRQTNGGIEWLNVLGTVKLNPELQHLLDNKPSFGIRATTLDDHQGYGRVIKNVVNLIAFDVVAESAVHDHHRYNPTLFKQSHDLKPPRINNVGIRDGDGPFNTTKVIDPLPWSDQREVLIKPSSLNFYLVRRHHDDSVDYEDYGSIIVAAASEADARRINPVDVGWADEDGDDKERLIYQCDHLEYSNTMWDQRRDEFLKGKHSYRYVYNGWVPEDKLDTLIVTFLGPCVVFDKPHMVLGTRR